MKNTLLVIVALLVGGCGKGEESTIGEPPKEEPAMSTDSIKALRDSVVGEYERKPNGDTYKDVYLENGIFEWYVNGKKQVEYKWSIVDGEIHVKWNSGVTQVYRINTDKSITEIADIRNGRRTDRPKEDQYTLKKIK